jgi:hypothetical protein
MLPREHGAWAILIGPIMVGLIGAPVFSPAAAALFVLGALAAFLVRAPLQALLAKPGDRRAQGWLAFYTTLTAGAFLPLQRFLDGGVRGGRSGQCWPQRSSCWRCWPLADSFTRLTWGSAG